MSLGPIIGGLTVLASFGVLLPQHDTRVARSAAAQVDLQIAAASPTPTPVKTEGPTLQAVAVDFPSSDRAFPPGPGAELVTNNCTACHSAGMILTQPKLTKATWLGEVNKMRSTYKAPVADEDVEPIAAYLAASLPAAH